MIWACAKAFSITGKDKYLHQAMDIAKWFAGNNIAGHMMYNPENGICYDGIISETEVNLNSGAESTIEALLSFQMLEQFSEYIDITSIYDE
jgi:hypothetical protein